MTTTVMPTQRVVADVLGTPVDAVTLERPSRASRPGRKPGNSRCVCACNVHSVATAARHEGLRRALADSDLNVAGRCARGLADATPGAAGQRASAART